MSQAMFPALDTYERLILRASQVWRLLSHSDRCLHDYLQRHLVRSEERERPEDTV